jgi:hypothetical protein
VDVGETILGEESGMDWRVVHLSAEAWENNVLGAIQNLFDRIWKAMGTPKEMALFCRSPMEDPVFTEVYFSPASVDLCLNIVAKHDGRPCQKPPKEPATALLVGDESASNDLL